MYRYGFLCFISFTCCTLCRAGLNTLFLHFSTPERANATNVYLRIYTLATFFSLHRCISNIPKSQCMCMELYPWIYYTIITVKGTHVPHKQKRKVVNTMSIDSMLELVNQYKEAAQLIEAAQAEAGTYQGTNQGRTCRTRYRYLAGRLPQSQAFRLHQYPPGQQSH